MSILYTLGWTIDHESYTRCTKVRNLRFLIVMNKPGIYQLKLFTRERPIKVHKMLKVNISILYSK